MTRKCDITILPNFYINWIFSFAKGCYTYIRNILLSYTVDDEVFNDNLSSYTNLAVLKVISAKFKMN